MLIDGKPILTNDAKLVCAIGMGNLSIIDPGQSGIVIG
jgi:hypothetical protein